MSSNYCTFDVSRERDRMLTIEHSGVMSTIGVNSLGELNDIGTRATTHGLARVIHLAEFLGVDDSVREEVYNAGPGLLLPSEDTMQHNRIEIARDFGPSSSTAVKPNLITIKQSFLATQYAYHETIGLYTEKDITDMKTEALAYVHRFGVGLLLYDVLEKTIATGNNIFKPADRNIGKASFAGYFALYLAQPYPEAVVDDIAQSSYVGEHPESVRLTTEVIQRHNPNRIGELRDGITFGMIRPMNTDEVLETLDIAKTKEKPRLTIV